VVLRRIFVDANNLYADITHEVPNFELVLGIHTGDKIRVLEETGCHDRRRNIVDFCWDAHAFWETLRPIHLPHIEFGLIADG